MTKTKPMPSLSIDGWVTDPIQVADYLMSHFFLSEYSQTALYPTHVTSLQYIVFENKGDPRATANKINQSLTIYFSRYFNDVIVQTSYKDDPNDATKAIVEIYIEFKDSENKIYSFSKGAELLNSKFNRIVHINNFVGEGG